MSTFVPICYLAIKCNFLLARVKRNLIKHAKKSIKRQLKKLIEQGTAQLNSNLTRSAQRSIIAMTTRVANSISKNFNQSNQQPTRPPLLQGNIKYVVLCFAILFVLLGIAIISGVIFHFQESNNICNHPSDSVILQHPELYVWNQCIFKTLPFSSFILLYFFTQQGNSVNCNCRQAKIDLQLIDLEFQTQSENVTSMIESIFVNWDMLETLYIIDEAQRYAVNLTDSHHYNTEHLKILHLEGIAVESLANHIENWKNLEYFSITKTHWHHWPENFNKLHKISYLAISDVKYITDLPPNICNMENLRALHVSGAWTATHGGFKEIPECMIHLPQLQSLILKFTLTNRVPYQLFSKSRIHEIGLMVTNISVSSFQLNDSAGEWSSLFRWNDNSETTYLLSGSSICDEWDGDRDIAFEFPATLKQFMNETNACEYVCDHAGFSQFLCSPFSHQNGVCDQECNVWQCKWDGGDCNQLCSYYSNDSCDIFSSFNNGECDVGCNNSMCSFDNHECDQVGVVNMGYYWYNYSENTNDTNGTVFCNNGSDPTSLCPISWVGDGWCDDYCRNVDTCLYDAHDCDCSGANQDSECYKIYQTSVLYITEEGNDYVTEDNLCQFWALVEQLSPETLEENGFASWHNKTCTEAFHDLDLNNDTIATISEIIEFVFEAKGLSSVQGKQVNCSSCWT